MGVGVSEHAFRDEGFRFLEYHDEESLTGAGAHITKYQIVKPYKDGVAGSV